MPFFSIHKFFKKKNIFFNIISLKFRNNFLSNFALSKIHTFLRIMKICKSGIINLKSGSCLQLIRCRLQIQTVLFIFTFYLS